VEAVKKDWRARVWSGLAAIEKNFDELTDRERRRIFERLLELARRQQAATPPA